MTRIALVLTVVLGAATATAATKAGVTMPDSVTVETKTLSLNGLGLREATIFDVDVYVAGLYVENVSSNAAKIVAAVEIKQIVLRFVRDVDRDDIVEAWTEGFAKNSTVPVAKLKALIAQLNRWMPSFDDGDTLTFTIIPGKGVAVVSRSIFTPARWQAHGGLPGFACQ